MDETESYEDIIKKRRQENREILKALGVFNENHELRMTKSSIPKSKRPSNKRPKTPNASTFLPVRRSKRLCGKMPEEEELIDEIQDQNIEPRIKSVKRENVFGAIPGIPVGTEFATRVEASHAGIHRPPVAGIHGNPLLGCYSIALSGGYEDDIDYGDNFVYTGEGGRDLKGTKANPKNLRTAPQSKNQVLERGNLALSKNVENKIPVRVIRGYKLNSDYAPKDGYRYDGIYMVDEYFITKGLSGFDVYKFRMRRVEDQDPPPWSILDKKDETTEKNMRFTVDEETEE